MSPVIMPGVCYLKRQENPLLFVLLYHQYGLKSHSVKKFQKLMKHWQQ